MIGTKHLRRLLACNKGSLMPLIGMAAVAMVTATGAAVDVGRAELVQMKLFSSLDSAGLSAATNRNKETIEPEAKKYLNVNFNNYLGAKITGFTIVPNGDNSLFTLHATAEVPTVFMNVVGVRTFTVAADSQITRTSKGLELVLVLDNTGSMLQSAGGSVTKLAAAKTASNYLLDILYGDSDTVDKLWVGVVPFSQAVNIGKENTGWLDAAYTNTLNYGPKVTGTVCTKYNNVGTYSAGPKCSYTLSPKDTYATFGTVNWQGCVEARGNGNAKPAYDLTDDPPSVKPFRPYIYPNGTNQNTWITANHNCTGGGGGYTPCKEYERILTQCNNWTYYPACCPINAESCTNPANCGKPPVNNPYPCYQNGACKVWGTYIPPVPQVCTSTTTNYDYSYSSWLGVNKGPNAFCPQPMQPMVASKRKVRLAINNMIAVGETEVPLGLAWGWRMLSPRWQGLWGGEMNANGLPLAYNTKLMTKVVILMTDGDNNIVKDTYSAYGPTNTNTQLGVTQCNATNCNPGINKLDNRTDDVCMEMKEKNIIIYTVALGASISQKSQAILQDCASSPEHFFLSPTTDALQGVFEKIAGSLTTIRVSQ